MNEQQWALVLGASSGFGEATALELAARGMNVFGVYLDRRETLPHAKEIEERIRTLGAQALFFNGNAADEEKRREVIAAIRSRYETEPRTVRVLLHSLAVGSLKPLVGADDVASKKQMEMTADVMGHSLVYWVQELVTHGLMRAGGRIYAMTSEGGGKAIPEYGPVCAAKAILEAHIRQLASRPTPLWLG